MALVVRYRADTLGLANGANVSSISPTTGAWSAMSAFGTTPTYVTPGQNGLGYVHADGGGYGFTPDVLQAQPYTVMLAWRLGPGTSGLPWDHNGVAFFFSGTLIDFNAGLDFVPPTLLDAGFHTFVVYANGASSIWSIDGKTVALGNAGTNSIPTSGSAWGGSGSYTDWGEFQLHTGNEVGGAAEQDLVARWLGAPSYRFQGPFQAPWLV